MNKKQRNKNRKTAEELSLRVKPENHHAAFEEWRTDLNW